MAGLLTPFPPVRLLPRLALNLRRAGGLDVVTTLLTPVASLGNQLFGGDHPRLLLSGNAGHADIPLDAPGSGLMGTLMSMLGQTVGFPVPAGGAGALASALADRFTGLGGEIRVSSAVDRVLVERGRAVGVRTVDGQVLRARHAVVADVIASRLYGGLVRPEDLPASALRSMRRFELDPSTVKVDWALDGPVPWAAPPPYAPGTVHVADSPEQITDALAQVSARHVPADPFLLVGQMSTADPSRSPAGTESLWAYTHVPQQSIDDAGGEGIRGVWDDADCQRFADRMQRRLERVAPGFESKVLARRVLGPRRARGPGRQPGRRRDQRRDVTAAPAAGVPAGAGDGTGRDAGPRALSRLRVRASRRWRARRSRQQRRACSHRPPALAPRSPLAVMRRACRAGRGTRAGRP